MEPGFTLVEIAIVVLVLGLLLASLLGPLSVRIEQQEIRKTSEQMEEIKEALYGYAMATGVLPCPDSFDSGDGQADPLVPTVASACEVLEGLLPYGTLGVVDGDAWGFRFRYRVTREFTVPDDDHLCRPDNNPSDPDYDYVADNMLDLCDAGDIDVKTRRYDDRDPPDLATNVPAVILSHGKNGYGAAQLDGTSIAEPPLWAATDADEGENTKANRTFVMRHYTTEPPGVPVCNDREPDAPYCAFDDIVVWLSANVLKYRLVQAGRLP